ncbi:MAG: transporter substrate-binding domain-containing protein [Rhizobiales bacterium]|nr:transporter substrate-binding domain-containing protein [Hyphomicrobiales bacterium]
MKLSRRVLVAAAAVAMMVSAGPAMADIKFGVAAEPYPPFASKDASGTWVGWEMDVMNAICAEMKEKCELVEVAWDGIIPALTSKQIDVIFASMLITDVRKETIDFSNMYYQTPPAIIGAKNGDMDVTPEHFKGKTIGVQVSTAHEKSVQKYYGDVAEIKTYGTQDEANSDIAAGRLDYVQANSSALDAFLATDEGKACCEVKSAAPMDVEFFGDGVGAGIRKEDTALRDKINAALSAMAASKKFDEITSKYPELVGKIVVPKN